MPHAHVILHRVGPGQDEVLLAQKNLYLPPHGAYLYAAIARHAVQYVIPGGKLVEGESAEQAAVREFFEDAGVALAAFNLRPLGTIGDRAFFEARNPEPFDLGAVNRTLRDGSARSLKSNNLAWVSRELAASWLGHKKEYETLPWVTEQVMRAIQAGFGRDHIARRAFDAHQPFVDALARL